MTGRADYTERLDELLKAFGRQIGEAPHAFPIVMQTVDFQTGPSREIVIAGDLADPAVRELIQTVRRPFLPNKVVLFRPTGENPEIAQLAPFTALQTALEGKATAYVCENFACKLPVHSPAELAALLAPKKP